MLTFGLIIYVPVLLADQEARPTPYILSLKNGKYYFKIADDPLFNFPHNYRSNGYLYQVVDDSCDTLLWKTQQFIGYRVYFVEDNIDYFVTIGDWPSGGRPIKEHMAIAFYHKGELIKLYSTDELIKDPSQIEPSVSHYEFLKTVVGFKEEFQFCIETIDGIVYEFDVKTGNILSEKEPWWRF